MARKVFLSKVSFEDGSVYIAGELYGTENEYHEDCESGKIEIIEEKTFFDKWNEQAPGLSNLSTFLTSLMIAYRNADGNNRAILGRAYPDFFTTILNPEL